MFDDLEALRATMADAKKAAREAEQTYLDAINARPARDYVGLDLGEPIAWDVAMEVDGLGAGTPSSLVYHSLDTADTTDCGRRTNGMSVVPAGPLRRCCEACITALSR